MNKRTTIDMIRLIAVATLAVVLAACAGRPIRPGLTPEQAAMAETSQVAREAQLRLQPEWALVGRIAVSGAGNGGSGRIEWRQDGDRFEVALSAPVTRQSWRLHGDPGGAHLEGLEGGPRSGADARLLLLEATGWDIPVTALAEWVRGLRAADLGPAPIRYGSDGRPEVIEQGGWSIGYEWPTAASPNGLPSRLDARREGARVRLIIDEWSHLAPDA